MAFDSYRDFANALDAAGELKRISSPVANELEIAEIAGREMKLPGGGRTQKWFIGCLAFFLMTFGIVSPVLADYPVIYQRYAADPSGLEYKGRLYVYCSNDDDNDRTNYLMHSITCFSTDDLKNWTDHGVVFDAKINTSWAGYAWAPSVITNNGLFYMYFGNGAGSIGVATSSVPTGPFVDAKGSALINSSTPGAYTPNQWYFDPCVFIDSDGQRYLYFGGNSSTNSRVIRLGANMTSTVGTAMPMGTTNFFEASYMHKRNGIYYYTYSSQPASTILCDTNSNPTNGFVHLGTVLNAPVNFYNNNQSSFFSYAGNWYCAYHNRYLSNLRGIPTGVERNLCLDAANFNANGTMQPVVCTTNGLPQLKYLNPYNRVEAETMAQENGIQNETCSEGGLDVGYITNNSWTKLKGVNFGSGGSTFYARVASAGSGGSIELHLDSLAGTLVGTCTVTPTGGWQTWTTAACSIFGAVGVHDLYFKYVGGSGYLFNVNWWQMQQGNPLQILAANYSRSNSSLALIWNSTPPAAFTNYSIQKKNFLSDPNWLTAKTGISSGGITTTNADNAASGNAAFYRISSP